MKMAKHTKRWVLFKGEKKEMIDYLTQPENDSEKVMEIYTKWASEYDQVN